MNLCASLKHQVVEILELPLEQVLVLLVQCMVVPADQLHFGYPLTTDTPLSDLQLVESTGTDEIFREGM